MERNLNEDRLAHYFAGELDEEEAAAMASWIRENPQRRARVEALRRVWEAAQQTPSPRRRDIDGMWHQLSERMEEAATRPESRSSPSRRETATSAGAQGARVKPRPDRPRRGRAGRQWSGGRSLRVATAVVVLSLVGAAAIFFAVRGAGPGPAGRSSSPAMREIATEAGQRARVKLSDGTQVVLNAKSMLRLPPGEFAEQRRKVHLQGEAYFEVAPDADRPFIVRAGGVTTHVLGTAFDVSAYSEDEAVQVTVAEGKVAARSEGAHAREVVLEAHQTGKLSSNQKEPVVQKGIDVTAYLAWTEGRLVFHDAPLEKVARKLERWYDLRVELDGLEGASVDRLNAAFEDESVEEILSTIARTLGLRYELDGKAVRFSPRGAPAPP